MRVIEKKIIEPAKPIFFILLFVSLGFIPSIANAGGSDLELARKLIVDGKPGEAFALLQPYEFERAGDTKFDYLLGLAALNSGKADKASLILERVLAVDPLYAAAWVDLGRAYYLLGDFERARSNFKHAQELNPPPAALATISLYLKEINSTNYQPKTKSSGYFEAGAGYNNNINNSTSQNLITALGLPVTLSSSNVKTADYYLGVAAGGETIHPISTDWSWYGGVDMHSRNDFKYHNFDYITLDGRVGASFNKNAEQIQGGLVTGQLNLGGAVNRKSNGVNMEWKHTYNNANQAILFSQYVIYRYPDPALSSNNFDQTIAGLGWMHFFTDGRSVVSGSLFGGNEHDTNLRTDGGKSLLGIHLSGQSPIAERLDFFASGGAQWSKYDRTNLSFLVVRDDRQADVTAGLAYSYNPNWIVRPQISLIQNQSNIVVNKYNQVDFSITWRRSFK